MDLDNIRFIIEIIGTCFIPIVVCFFSVHYFKKRAQKRVYNNIRWKMIVQKEIIKAIIYCVIGYCGFYVTIVNNFSNLFNEKDYSILKSVLIQNRKDLIISVIIFIIGFFLINAFKFERSEDFDRSISEDNYEWFNRYLGYCEFTIWGSVVTLGLLVSQVWVNKLDWNIIILIVSYGSLLQAFWCFRVYCFISNRKEFLVEKTILVTKEGSEEFDMCYGFEIQNDFVLFEFTKDGIPKRRLVPKSEIVKIEQVLNPFTSLNMYSEIQKSQQVMDIVRKVMEQEDTNFKDKT